MWLIQLCLGRAHRASNRGLPSRRQMQMDLQKSCLYYDPIVNRFREPRASAVFRLLIAIFINLITTFGTKTLYLI